MDGLFSEINGERVVSSERKGKGRKAMEKRSRNVEADPGREALTCCQKKKKKYPERERG